MNPYPGLRPFREDESHWFFGRDGQTDEILARLAAERFVGIVGVSGCGKSSLIHAGVFPGLHGGLLPTGQREWRIARMQPRNEPIRNLARELVAAKAVVDAGETGTAALVEGMLRTSTHALADLLHARLAHDGPGAFALLLVVDQFEELFRFARSGSAEEAGHFVQLLLTLNALAQERESPLFLALAMRSDFVGDCAAFPALPERINRSQFLVPRLNLAEREAAIVRPAATQQQGLARALVDRLLDDIGEDPDQLPVLQHALSRTWEVWEKSEPRAAEIGLAHYLDPQVGGMSGAINLHAEKAYESLTAAQRPLAAALFRCITERAEDRRAIRRPLPLGQIAEIAGTTPAEMERVIDAFRTQGRTFLTPPEGKSLQPSDVIDISHESLIRNWPRLMTWAKQESAAAGELRRQRQGAAEFFRGNQGPLDRLELHRVERWRRGVPADDLTADIAIVPSATWIRLNIAADEDAAEICREVDYFIAESRRRLDAEDKKRRRDQWVFRSLVAFVFALVAGFGVYFFGQKKEADELKSVAVKEAGQRLAVVNSFSDTSRQLVELLTGTTGGMLERLEKQEADVLAALEQAAGGKPPPEASLVDTARWLRDRVEDTADKMELLQGSFEKATEVIKEETLSAQSTKAAEYARYLRTRLKAGPAAAKVLEVATKAMNFRLDEADKALTHADNSATEKPDREKALALADDHMAALDPLMAAATAIGLTVDNFSRISPRRSALNAKLAGLTESANTGDGLETWLAGSNKPGEIPIQLKHTGRVMRMRFAPKTQPPVLVSATDDRKTAMTFWDGSGRKVDIVSTSNGLIDLAFNPEGTALATASSGSTVRIYSGTGNIASRGRIRELHATAVKAFERHADTVTDVEFSQGGELIVSASADRTVRVFKAADLTQKYFTSPPLPKIVTAAVFHRGGNLVASACDDGFVRLHTIDQPGVVTLLKFDAPARRPDFSPDGKFVVACSGDRTARVASIVRIQNRGRDRDLQLKEFDHRAPVVQASFQPSLLNPPPALYAIATVAADGIVRFARSANGLDWPDLTVLNPPHPGAPHQLTGMSLTWREDGGAFASVGGGEVLLWKMESDEPKPRLRIGGLPRETSRVEFSADGALLLAYGADENAWLFRLPAPF